MTRKTNIKPYKVRRKPGDPTNLMDSTQWELGTNGSQGDFSRNGATNENSIEEGVGPYGDTVNLWYGRSEDSESNSDGGWNWYKLDAADIDPTKKYRYSVWVRQEYTSGRVYHGTERVYDYGSESYDSNPYYFSGDLPEMNEWYLIVGYNRPEGAEYAHEGAIYDTSGEKVKTIQDYRWDLDGGTDNLRFRTYYYYDTNVGRGAHFYDPRLDICDGNEPSISELTQPATDNSW